MHDTHKISHNGMDAVGRAGNNAATWVTLPTVMQKERARRKRDFELDSMHIEFKYRQNQYTVLEIRAVVPREWGEWAQETG